MAQASSAYSTSGTQYNATNSYYLLDSVPGSGDAIPGPVTITAAPPAVALTVAGNAVATGDVGVSGTLTVPAIASNSTGSWTAASGLTLTSITSNVVLNAATGNATVSAGAGTLTLNATGNATLASTAGQIIVQAGAGQNATVGAGLAGVANLVSTGPTSKTNVVSGGAVALEAGNGTLTLTSDVGGISLFAPNATDGVISLNPGSSRTVSIVTGGGLSILPCYGSPTAPIGIPQGSSFQMPTCKGFFTITGAGVAVPYCALLPPDLAATPYPCPIVNSINALSYGLTSVQWATTPGDLGKLVVQGTAGTTLNFFVTVI